MKVDSYFQVGERFFKWSNKRNRKEDCSVKMYIDPNGHILYWRKRSYDTEMEWSHLYVDEIVDVRTGKYADTRYLAGNNEVREQLMTIVTNADFVHPHFHTFMHETSVDVLQKWAQFIFDLSQSRRKEYHGLQFYILRQFAPIRFPPIDPRIPVNQIAKILRPYSQNRQPLEKVISSLFNKQDFILKKDLTDEVLMDTVAYVIPRPEVQEIFRKLSDKKKTNGEPVISRRAFSEFVMSRQRDPRLNEVLFPPPTIRQFDFLVKKYSSDNDNLTCLEFLRFLMSDYSADMDSKMMELNTEELHHPLPHYYISCSHNTYLTGAQMMQTKLISSIKHDVTRSDVEIYRQTLLSGCRCVELDCWDGGDGEPVITHGPTEITLLNTVPFRDVVEAIDESAFKTSPLPVVLSIENHCSVPQQKKMAEYFREIFGDKLLADPLPNHPLEPEVLPPSPWELRYKILIKAKKPSSHKKSSNAVLSPQVSNAFDLDTESWNSRPGTSTESRAGSIDIDPLSIDKMGVVRRKNAHSERVHTMESVEEEREDGDPSESNCHLRHMMEVSPEQARIEKAMSSQQNEASDSIRTKLNLLDGLLERKLSMEISPRQLDEQLKPEKEVDKVARELSEIVNYVQSMSSAKLNVADETDKRYYIMHSFSEDAIKNLVESRERAGHLARHCVRQIARVYPSGMRYASSNYNPIYCWMVGCQMTALNYQTNSLGMLINEAMFEHNGRSGYILKPKCLRDLSVPFDPYVTELHNVISDSLEITVLSGQFLHYLHPGSSKSLSTYVIVDLYDLPRDSVRNRHRTRVVKKNGWNPVYFDRNIDKPFTFKKVIKPEFAFIHIRVMDEADRELGSRLLPVNKMKRGYRHIMLRTLANRPAGPASVFVYVNVHFHMLSTQKDLHMALIDPLTHTQQMQHISKNLVDPLDDYGSDEESSTYGMGVGVVHDSTSPVDDTLWSEVISSGQAQLQNTTNTRNPIRRTKDSILYVIQPMDWATQIEKKESCGENYGQTMFKSKPVQLYIQMNMD